MKGARTPPALATLIVLTGVSILSINMFATSLAHMAADFQVDYAVMSIAVGGYLFMTALLQLIFGPLSDLYGRRPLILIGMAIFALASVVCALTENVQVFLVARMCQAASATGVALSRAIIRDQYEGRAVAQKMATVAMVMAVAPLMGPALGGVIDQLLGWRATFWLYALIGIGIFALAWVDLGETNHHRAASFSEQFRAYPELVAAPRFWGYTICWSFSVASFHTFVAGAPLAVSGAFALPPSRLGVYMGVMTLGYIAGNMVSARVARHLDWPLTRMMIIGRVVAILAIGAALAQVLLGEPRLEVFFCAAGISGLSNGLSSPNAAAGVMSVRPQLAGSASGLSSAMIMLMGGVGATLQGLVITAGNGVTVVLTVMFAAGAISLAAALWVRWLEGRRAREEALSAE
ncbi:multidrug effflux MFS transporter [Pseudooceanicola sp. HF7]|nr:multidrug effflux MFS transporter [Pseudooceanicola sp. HF7]